MELFARVVNDEDGVKTSVADHHRVDCREVSLGDIALVGGVEPIAP